MKWPPLGLAVALALVAFQTALKSARNSDTGPGACQVERQDSWLAGSGPALSPIAPIELYDVGFYFSLYDASRISGSAKKLCNQMLFFIRSPWFIGRTLS
jgi:hypothetical protein